MTPNEPHVCGSCFDCGACYCCVTNGVVQGERYYLVDVEMTATVRVAACSPDGALSKLEGIYSYEPEIYIGHGVLLTEVSPSAPGAVVDES